MMDMIRITKEMIPETETVDVVGKDGTVVTVKKHIPYIAKQMFGLQYVSYINTTNNDIQTMYNDYNRIMIKTILICKYYTNIDLSFISSQSDLAMLFDWIVFNCLYDDMIHAIEYDIRFVDHIIDDMICAVRNNYNKQHDIGYAIKKTFGFLLTGQDFVSTLMDMPDVNNDIIKVFSSIKKIQNDNPKKSNKVITPTGNIVNISKKNI